MSSFVKASETYQQGQRTLPGRYYTSPEIYAEEQERIFTARWICVGRAADIPAAGDYVLRTIAGESVIVVRGRDGALRAFYNVCRHRGTRLCEEPRGRFSETIQCPYHAWTYTIDGQLIGAPHMSEVQGFDKRAYPLHAVPLGSKNKTNERSFPMQQLSKQPAFELGQIVATPGALVDSSSLTV